MKITCVYCMNRVPSWREGVMAIQVAHHALNHGGLCPGSGQRRSLAR